MELPDLEVSITFKQKDTNALKRHSLDRTGGLVRRKLAKHI